MKRLWMIVSTLAIANMLAIGGLLAWLHTSGRLNKERITAVRTMLKPTLAEEQQAKAAAESRMVAEKDAADEAAKMSVPPETAASRIDQKQLDAEKQLQNLLRQKQELVNLRDGLMKQLDDLSQREQRLASQRAAFEEERRRIAETDGTQQFKIALSALESQKPKDAKAVLKALLDGHQMDQVVAYLSRMDETKRSKVIAEFVKDEATLAADLLERLRTRGLNPQAMDADPTAMAAAGAGTGTNQHEAGTAKHP